MHDTRTNIGARVSTRCRRSCFHYALRMDGDYWRVVQDTETWACTDSGLWALPSRAPAARTLLSASGSCPHSAHSLLSTASIFNFLTPARVISSTFTSMITSCFQCATAAWRIFNCRCARHSLECRSSAWALPLTADSKNCSLFGSWRQKFHLWKMRKTSKKMLRIKIDEIKFENMHLPSYVLSSLMMKLYAAVRSFTYCVKLFSSVVKNLSFAACRLIFNICTYC